MDGHSNLVLQMLSGVTVKPAHEILSVCGAAYFAAPSVARLSGRHHVKYGIPIQHILLNNRQPHKISREQEKEMAFMSKTDENLKAAVAGESLARNRYSYFAEMANKEGYRYIA